MALNENDNKVTGRAWDRLYNRLEQDGLLIGTIPEKVNVRPAIMKWSAVAAVICICAISAFIIRNRGISQNDMLTIQNEKDAPTLVSTLEDGSVIYLSEYTSVRYPYHFSKDKREVTLQGNAFFDISRNPDKPFIIDTKRMIIEVLGTSFSVTSKDDESFSLSVRHGEVKVTSKKDGKTVNVKDGETAFFHSDDLQKIKTADINQFKSYLKRVHFKDQRLADVVKVINTNSDSIRLKITPELENRLLTVTFSDDTPYTMAQLICLALNLQYTQQQNTILISQK